jgi:glutamate N-acetyltransferase/amino-acid N-acetyltransferase
MANPPACPGFRFAGMFAGVKKTMRPDLGLVLAEDDVPATAVFTRNQVRAAPVVLS